MPYHSAKFLRLNLVNFYRTDHVLHTCLEDRAGHFDRLQQNVEFISCPRCHHRCISSVLHGIQIMSNIETSSGQTAAWKSSAPPTATQLRLRSPLHRGTRGRLRPGLPRLHHTTATHTASCNLRSCCSRLVKGPPHRLRDILAALRGRGRASSGPSRTAAPSANHGPVGRSRSRLLITSLHREILPTTANKVCPVWCRHNLSRPSIFPPQPSSGRFRPG